MLIKQLKREGAEQIFVVGQNAAGEKLSVGVNVCFDWRNSSSLGVAVIKPTTSTLTLYAGVLAHKQPNYADLPSNSFGLIQVYGVHGSVAYNVGAASCSCGGQWLVPLNGLYSGQTNNISGLALSWTSQALMVARGAFIMEDSLSATGWCNAFVRAL